MHRFLPAETILEIAPGYGRWTQFLKDRCESMVVVDLSPKCIEHCKERFAGDSRITYHVNDGRSLDAIPDQSIDFVFSFDSLVHAESDVIRAYLNQLGRKLKRNGAGFMHHSNIGAYRRRLNVWKAYHRLPEIMRRKLVLEPRLESLMSINIEGWRAHSMTAELFAEHCRESGMQCVSQELFSWVKGTCLIDGISVFTPIGSKWARETIRWENKDFLRDARVIRKLAHLYRAEPQLPGTVMPGRELMSECGQATKDEPNTAA
jgi:ubiquinone/menaquinone biosynthesis C-methylase UbiE